MLSSIALVSSLNGDAQEIDYRAARHRVSRCRPRRLASP